MPGLWYFPASLKTKSTFPATPTWNRLNMCRKKKTWDAWLQQNAPRLSPALPRASKPASANFSRLLMGKRSGLFQLSIYGVPVVHMQSLLGVGSGGFAKDGVSKSNDAKCDHWGVLDPFWLMPSEPWVRPLSPSMTMAKIKQGNGQN